MGVFAFLRLENVDIYSVTLSVTLGVRNPFFGLNGGMTFTGRTSHRR